MAFFNILKVLFERAEHDGHLVEMDRLLGEKMKSIDELRMKKNCLMMEYTFSTMEHYTLSNILQEALYRKNYAEMLEIELDKLLDATLKLGFVLERVQWHKLLNCDELVNVEKKRKHDNMQREMRELYAKMENRQIVIVFRYEQQKKVKLLNWLENHKKADAKQRQLRKAKIDAAIQKRNDYIVELVKGAKVLEELRLKIQQKKSEIKASQNDELSSLQIISNEKRLDSINESLRQSSKRGFEEKTLSNVGFKPLKPTLKFTFNEFIFEQFDFDKVEENQKIIKSFENNFHMSMPSVNRDFMRNPIENTLTQREEFQSHDVFSTKCNKNNRKCEKENPPSILSPSNDMEINKTFAIETENSSYEPMMIDQNERNCEMEEEQIENERPMPKNKMEKEKSKISYTSNMEIKQKTISTSVSDVGISLQHESDRRKNDQGSQKGDEKASDKSFKAAEPLGTDIFQDWSSGFDSKTLMFSDQDNQSAFSEMSSHDSDASAEMEISCNKQQNIF